MRICMHCCVVDSRRGEKALLLKQQFVRLVAGISQAEAKKSSLCRCYLQLSSTPKTLDLVFYVAMTTVTTDTTDCFTPAAHAHAG